jgi:hypothetical protein
MEQENNNTLVSLTEGGEILAVLMGIQSHALNEGDFTTKL